jgi:hypothetical protein
MKGGPGKITQRLRALALAEDPWFIQYIYINAHKMKFLKLKRFLTKTIS